MTTHPLPIQATAPVACIIPTHGRPELLATALDSVLGQTMAPAEVAVVDDLDDAPTAAVVAAAAGRATFPVRHIVNLSKPGASGSRNAGATASTAPVLAFLDDDDAWRPDYLVQAVAALQQSGADAVITGLTRYRQDGAIQKIVMPPRHAIERRLYEKNFGMTGSNLVITRTAFDWAGRFDPALPVFNDWDFLIRMVGASVTYTVVEELLVEWREHMGDRISTPTVRRAIGIETFVAKHERAMPPVHRRNLMADALGIRRRNAGSLFGRAVLAAQLLRLLGPREAIGRRLRPTRASMLESGALTMRTVLVAHSRDGLGGSVITGALLAKAMDEGGEWKTLSVCNSEGPPLDYHRSIGLDALPLMESQGLPYRPNPQDGNRLRRMAKRLMLFRAARRFLKKVSPAIIHVHDESSALAWGLAAREKGIPLVWQVHQQKPQVYIDWLLRRLAAHVVFVAANNQRRFDGVALPPSTVVYNGVDLSRFFPAPPRGAGSGVRVGFISNLVDRKRPDWLVRAAGILLREGIDIQVVLAGNDFSGGAKAAELAELARREGLADRYEYLGPRSDVPDILRALDVLVLASERDKEAFPRIVVEAMACGVPVLATAVAGIPEAVADGETGLLVDPDDFSAFVDALRRLATDAELRHRFGAAAVARSRAMFSMEANAQAIADIYRQVIAAPDAPRRALSSFAGRSA